MAHPLGSIGTPYSSSNWLCKTEPSGAQSFRGAQTGYSPKCISHAFVPLPSLCLARGIRYTWGAGADTEIVLAMVYAPQDAHHFAIHNVHLTRARTDLA